MRSHLRLIGHVGSVALFSAGPLFAEDGPSLYKQLCSSCHDMGFERAPDTSRRIIVVLNWAAGLTRH